MRRYLIVANQTLGGDALSAKLAESMRAGPCRFYLVARSPRLRAPISGPPAGSTAG
jgi:hypothetical protein